MRVLLWPVLLAPLGCTQEPVLIRGVVYDGRGDEAQPVSGVDVTVVSPARGEVYGAGSTDDEGIFEVELSRGNDSVAIEVRAEGFVTTVLHGVAPPSGSIAVPDKALYLLSEAEHAAMQARWAGCPGVEEGGGVVFGDVRLFGFVDPVSGDNPTTSEAQLGVYEIEPSGKVGEVWSACYLDDQGSRYDETAEFTGPSGEFAIFGVGPGFHELRVDWQAAPNQWSLFVYPAWVPEDADAALPTWPAWVELKL